MPAAEQLRQVTAILLRSWRRQPDLVRVLVREVARSPGVQQRVDEIGEVFAALERIVARGQAAGEFRADVEPTARELDPLRRDRGDPHGLGARAAPRR